MACAVYGAIAGSTLADVTVEKFGINWNSSRGSQGLTIHERFLKGINNPSAGAVRKHYHTPLLLKIELQVGLIPEGGASVFELGPIGEPRKLHLEARGQAMNRPGLLHEWRQAGWLVD
jgi:hypothetical protein